LRLRLYKRLYTRTGFAFKETNKQPSGQLLISDDRLWRLSASQ
jgi:hypothetical protein